MKKILLSIAILSSGFAHGFIDLPVEITPISADFRCEQQNGKGLAIALPKGNQPGQVWHSKSGDQKGLELKVTDFKVARCPGCFKFTALLMDQEVMGEVSDFNLVYSGKNKKGEVKELLRAKCLPVAQSLRSAADANSFNSAFLKICPASVVKTEEGIRLMPAPGCLNKIVVNQKEFVVTTGNKQVEKILGNIIGANQFHKILKSQPFSVQGRVDKMVIMGYEREVFVVTKIDPKSVVLPKGM